MPLFFWSHNCVCRRCIVGRCIVWNKKLRKNRKGVAGAGKKTSAEITGATLAGAQSPGVPYFVGQLNQGPSQYIRNM